MRYLYEVDIADPTLYELVVNTEKMKYEAVVAVAEALVRRPEMATTDAGRQMVASRALASRVQVALATHPETRRYRITVEAHAGIVTLEGTAALERAVEVARIAGRQRREDPAGRDPADSAVRGVGRRGRAASGPGARRSGVIRSGASATRSSTTRRSRLRTISSFTVLPTSASADIRWSWW